MLTTIDNPYNPYEDYDKWNQWDEDQGYFTANYLARLAMVDENMDDETADAVIDETIDTILDYNVLGIYIRAIKPSKASKD